MLCGASCHIVISSFLVLIHKLPGWFKPSSQLVKEWSVNTNMLAISFVYVSLCSVSFFGYASPSHPPSVDSIREESKASSPSAVFSFQSISTANLSTGTARYSFQNMRGDEDCETATTTTVKENKMIRRIVAPGFHI